MPPAQFIAPLAALLAALVCVRAEVPDDVIEAASDAGRRADKSLGTLALPPGCLYEGRWFTDGATVSTGEACLHCVCFHGALTCRRRACAPLPDPPPHRCHILHRRGSCCPELHCPDGIILMEQGASARYESDDAISAPASISHACVEGGTVYAAGSAMRSSVACEQCFCLGGARRCVRPKCLPPPLGCRPRPAPGACCPQRYYCEHRTTKPPEQKHPHDCKVESKWISEGERVPPLKNDSNCTQCFCLRGSVQCQPLSCAPPLLGCEPLLRPGECCAHQYHCEHKHQGSQFQTLSSNALTLTNNDDRGFHAPKSNKHETTTKNTLANIFTVKNIPTLSATKNHLISTTKVKRKTSDPPPETSSLPPEQNTTVLAVATASITTDPTTVTVAKSTTTTAKSITTTAKLITTTTKFTTTTELPSTTELVTEPTSTEQPEGSLRIVINGTINCTAELSSTSLPLNITVNNTEKINFEAHPRVPLIDVSNLDDHTFSPNDIITDGTVNDRFDENESYVINVTSSLTANTNRTSTKAPASAITKISLPMDIPAALNSSKKTKGDYDYDYNEPTLPPSLPNLKIIPFVAADAVVEDDHPKSSLTYPNLEREDKFPVYYPTVETKDTAYATRREDVYRSTQYPVFITDKPDQEQYPSLTHDTDLTNTGYSNVHSYLDDTVDEFLVSASLGNRVPDVGRPVTKTALTTTTNKIETPAINLFSPPVETEGGFVPKGPTGVINEYFAVFPSTLGPPVPHLTTSMQLDVAKECVSSDGRHIADGDSITMACSKCTCTWGVMHCSPRSCPIPSGCHRRPASSNAGDQCCGELICDIDNRTTSASIEIMTEKQNISKDNMMNNNEKTTATNLPALSDPRNKWDATRLVGEVSKNTTYTNQEVSLPVENIETKNKTFASSTTTIKPTTAPAAPVFNETDQSNHSLEYEEDEEDDGFSFGSVLKLLLSDNYETTTTTTQRIFTTTKLSPPPKYTTTRKPRPTLVPSPPRQTIAPFIPLAPYNPQKMNQNPINRIDHLVLGEATAIKKSTPRPITTTLRSIVTNKPSGRPSTQRIVTKTSESTKVEEHTTEEAPRPPGGLGPGLLKLAGCNIYGRMYRVGRIITELSTPCQECWCTEFGVQCKQLKC